MFGLERDLDLVVELLIDVLELFQLRITVIRVSTEVMLSLVLADEVQMAGIRNLERFGRVQTKPVHVPQTDMAITFKDSGQIGQIWTDCQ